MSEITKENYLQKLFINEAKAGLKAADPSGVEVDALEAKLEHVSGIMVGTAEPDPSNVIEGAIYIRVLE